MKKWDGPKRIQFDNYLQGKVRLFEERFLNLEYL